MKRKLLVCALVACAMTLCLALTGCGGGGATNDKDAKEAFIGSWKLAGMVSDGEEATAEDIAMLDAFGMSVGLNVNEDGTCALIMFGEPLDGTWEAKSATEAKFTIDGSPITATIADGKLQMTDGGYAMTFERGEVKANSNDGDSKAASTTDKSTVAVDKVLARRSPMRAMLFARVNVYCRCAPHSASRRRQAGARRARGHHDGHARSRSNEQQAPRQLRQRPSPSPSSAQHRRAISEVFLPSPPKKARRR